MFRKPTIVITYREKERPHISEQERIPRLLWLAHRPDGRQALLQGHAEGHRDKASTRSDEELVRSRSEAVNRFGRSLWSADSFGDMGIRQLFIIGYEAGVENMHTNKLGIYRLTRLFEQVNMRRPGSSLMRLFGNIAIRT